MATRAGEPANFLAAPALAPRCQKDPAPTAPAPWQNIDGHFEIIYCHYVRLLTKRNREIYLKCCLFQARKQRIRVFWPL